MINGDIRKRREKGAEQIFETIEIEKFLQDNVRQQTTDPGNSVENIKWNKMQ